MRSFIVFIYRTTPSKIFSALVPLPLLTLSIACCANVHKTVCMHPIASMSYLCSVFSSTSMKGNSECGSSIRLCAPETNEIPGIFARQLRGVHILVGEYFGISMILLDFQPLCIRFMLATWSFISVRQINVVARPARATVIVSPIAPPFTFITGF